MEDRQVSKSWSRIAFRGRHESRNGSYGIEWIRLAIRFGDGVSRSLRRFAVPAVSAVPCFVGVTQHGYVTCATEIMEDVLGERTG